MTSSLVRPHSWWSQKNIHRMESRKSHSWWWNSHISPKNSKWLPENLDDMDRSVKKMLKLIEEDGDSFAKKAEMYYQKRPELIAHVEDFYHMYRSLAERYDHLAAELRRSTLSDAQSQSSGVSDIGSVPTSPERRQRRRTYGPRFGSVPTSPERELGQRRSSARAAGFDFFLGMGGNVVDMRHPEGDAYSSQTDSESESDAESVHNCASLSGHGGDFRLNTKTIELDIELRELKEKQRMQQEENANNSLIGANEENNEKLLARISEYKKEQEIAMERIRCSEDLISRLKAELQKFTAQEFLNGIQPKHDLASDVQGYVRPGAENSISDPIVRSMYEELRNSKERLLGSENQSEKLHQLQDQLALAKQEITNMRRELESYQSESSEKHHLREQLELAKKEITNMRCELESNQSESSEKLNQLQEQLGLVEKEISMWKSKLQLEKEEVTKLQNLNSWLRSRSSAQEHEIRDLRMAVPDADKKTFPEKTQLKAEITKLLGERNSFKEQLSKWEIRSRSLEDEIKKVRAEKNAKKERLNSEIEKLKSELNMKNEKIETLGKTIDALRVERDELDAVTLALEAKIRSRDDQITDMNKLLQKVHVEHVELMTNPKSAHKQIEALKSKVRELEAQVEQQKVLILEGAEEKREAIRQLCLSIEHYRDEYARLRQAIVGRRQVQV